MVVLFIEMLSFFLSFCFIWKCLCASEVYSALHIHIRSSRKCIAMNRQWKCDVKNRSKSIWQKISYWSVSQGCEMLNTHLIPFRISQLCHHKFTNFSSCLYDWLCSFVTCFFLSLLSFLSLFVTASFTAFDTINYAAVGIETKVQISLKISRTFTAVLISQCGCYVSCKTKTIK